MSRGYRPAKPIRVKWAVTTDKVIGPLTIQRFLNLHRFVDVMSDQGGVPLNAYRPPADADPRWYFQHAGGETWRFMVKGRFVIEYQFWWRYEWRTRTKPPKWVRALAWSIDYGKRRKFGEDGVEIPPPPKESPPDAEQQLTLF